MIKKIVNDSIRQEFDKELQQIMYNNHKELNKLEWELYDTQGKLQDANLKIKKLKSEKKKLEDLIKKYDIEVNDEYKRKK